MSKEKKETAISKYSNMIIIGTFSFVIILSLILNFYGLFVKGQMIVGFDVTLVTILFLVFYVKTKKLFHDKFSFLSPNYYYITMFFAFLAVFLGSYLNFYEMIPWWDTMLHFSSGILLGLVSIIAVTAFIIKNFDDIDSQIDIVFIVVVGILVSISYAVFWEFYEFCYDYIVFGGNMQRSIIVNLELPMESQFDQLSPYIRASGRYIDEGLMDTMKDMFLATIGAMIAGVYAYFHMMNQFKHQIK